MAIKTIKQLAKDSLSRVNSVTIEQPVTIQIDDEVAVKFDSLFAELQTIYPAWKHSGVTLDQLKRSWLKAFAVNGITSMAQIKIGVNKARQSTSPFLPSVGQFCKWCKPTHENFGLPTVEQALREASAKIRFSDEQYSHPAVYVASKATGAWELKTMTFDKLLPIFKHNYQIACKRVMNGEDLAIEIPKALPASISIPTDRNKSLSIISELKQKNKNNIRLLARKRGENS